MQMVMFMREISRMMQQQDMVNSHTLMMPTTKDTGLRTNNVDKARRCGQMEPNMWVSIRVVGNMVREL